MIHMPHNEVTPFIVGMITSAVVGFIAIKYII